MAKRSIRLLLRALSPSVLLLAACAGGPAAPARPDLLIITVDSLRADRPGFAGGPVRTPAMDGLAGRAVRFESAYTTAPQALPSMASLMTGLYPAAHGAREDWVTRLDDGVVTLASRLQEAGYRTAAFPAAMAFHPKHGLDRGFQVYREAFGEIPRLTASDRIGIPGKRVAGQALEWLGGLEEGQPWFLWVNFFDAHYFHNPEPPFKAQYADSPYDGEVAMVDEQVGRLLSWLSDHGRDETTLVILTANHGEGLGEGGEQFYGILLGEPTVRVPLIIRPPGGLESARVVDGAVSLVDVAPTILDLLGLDPPEGSGEEMDGISLAPLLREGDAVAEDRPVYFETLLPQRLFGWAPLRGVRAGDLKYVEAPGTGWRSLHDLDADPGQEEDLSRGPGADLARLAEVAAERGPGITQREHPMDDETAGMVASLGYDTEPLEAEPELPTERVDVGNAALQARRSLQRRMMRSALFLLNDVLATDPDNYVALLDVSLISLGINQPDVAERNLLKLQDAYPSDGEVYHQMGHLALVRHGEGSLERAGILFQIATRLAPLNEEALYDSACAVSAENPDLALDYLERAVRNGFRDFDHMSRDPDMDPLRETARFQEITGLAPPSGESQAAETSSP